MMMKTGFVSIIGRPNAGKSTLLNRLVGEKVSIVSDKSQTTRLAIQGIYEDETTQIVFVDTPGIHKPKARLGERMNAQAFGSLEGIDVVVLLVDSSVPFGKGDEYILERIRFEKHLIIAFNKIDQVNIHQISVLKDKYKKACPDAVMVELSALKNALVNDFLTTIKSFLKQGPRYFPKATKTNVSEAFRLTEFIREKVLFYTYEEIPHSVAVTIDQIESENDTRTIYASIIVEKDSQKGILIGEKGQRIRSIRLATIRDVKRHLKLEVALELFVRVEKNWRDSIDKLKEFGLL
jgi:GTP-binding protein Era